MAADQGRAGADLARRAPGDDAIDNRTRLLETYQAFVEGQLDRIPEFFAPDGVYRNERDVPGNAGDLARGTTEIEAFWHAANEPWESFEIEPRRSAASRRLRRSRKCGSRAAAPAAVVEATIDAGHLVELPRRH